MPRKVEWNFMLIVQFVLISPGSLSETFSHIVQAIRTSSSCSIYMPTAIEMRSGKLIHVKTPFGTKRHFHLVIPFTDKNKQN